MSGSSAGQIIGGAIGAVAGFVVGGPVGAVQGASLGFTLGGVIDPPSGPNIQGPRLDDLKVQVSTYGDPIPLIYGPDNRVSGNVIWSTGLVESEKTEDVGGKGGGGSSQTTYSYSTSLALALSGRRCDNVRRIWANGKVIFVVPDGLALPAMDQVNGLCYVKAFQTVAPSITQVGDPLPVSTGAPALAYIGGSDVAFFDHINEQLRTYRFSGSTWSQVGGGLGVTSGGAVALASLGSDVALVESTGNMLRKYQFSGGSWAQVGNALVVSPGLNLPSMVSLGLNSVAMADFESSELRAFSFDGLNWSQVGSSLFVSGMGSSAMASIGGSQFAFFDALNRELRTYSFSGSSFSQVGNSLSIPAASSEPALAELPGKDIAFVDSANNDIARYRFDGLDWAQVGSNVPLGFGAGGPAVAAISDTDVAYIDDQSNALRTFRFEGGNGEVPGTEVNGVFFPVEMFSVFAELCVYPGSTVQVPNSHIEGVEGSGNAPAYRGISYIMIKDLQLADFGNRLPNIEVEFEAESQITVGQIMHDISIRSGVDNASAAGLSDNVLGYAVSQGSGLGAVTPLAIAFFIDITEQRGQIRFVKRGRGMKGTIDLPGMGARQSNQAPITPVEYSKLPPVDLPRESSVVYADPEFDYQRNTQRAFRDQGSAVNHDSTELPLTLTQDQARRIADRLLWLPWTARRGVKVQLPDKWLRASPGDVFGIPVAGQVLPYKLVKMVRGDNGILAAELQQEDLLAYDSTATGGAGRLPLNELELPGITRLFLIDSPIVRDEDDDTGFYWAVTAESSGWRGASVLRSSDGGSTFSQMGSIGVRATAGDVSGTVPSGPTELWDRTTTITVVLAFEDDVLESRTEEAVLSGANLVWLGDTTGQGGEMLQFATATLIDTLTYELTDLLRGRLGTEANVGTHGPDEVLVMASQTTGRRDDFGPGDWGVSRKYKPVSILNDQATAAEQDFTNDGQGKTPYSPVHITGDRDGSDNLTIEWVRRTRLRVPGLGSGPVPLGEQTEAYEIDILDGSSPPVVLRTLTSTTPTVEYSAADQTTDGLTPGDPVDIIVFQISDIKGRGNPGSATV